jgi:hypothetical protein
VIPSVSIIWDYDTAIGQVNASYPYKFQESRLIEEIENVDRILELAAAAGVRMTFACVGFAAEPGHYPYHVPEQLRRIHAAGHELASHSWRHEWFPALESEQVRRSLARSKLAIETCIGAPGAVSGFVPPFSRPMTWFAKGAISLGDRASNPWRAGANIGALCRAASAAGYTWCRVAYRPLLQRLTRSRQRAPIHDRLERAGGVACVPQHYLGFDAGAVELIARASASGGSVVIAGHPSALSRQRSESFAHFEPFLKHVADLQSSGKMKARTVTEHIALESAGP